MSGKDDGLMDSLSTEMKELLVKAKVSEAEAAAENHRAEAELHRANTRSADLYNEREAIITAKAKRSEAEELAANKFHHVYNFGSVVNDSSVNGCIDQLTKWTRIDGAVDIEIVFNSPGGSIIDGFALFDYIQMLRRKGHHITTTTLGMAASMAGVLLQAGDVRRMGAEAVILIHEASFGAMGKTGEVEDTMELVKKLQKRIVKIFASRSKMSVREIERRWKRKDWWITSDEALKLGLVDEVL